MNEEAGDTALLAAVRPYLRHCGVSRRKAWRIPSRKLLDFLVVYLDEGQGRFMVGDKVWEAVPGDLFWIPPDTVHDMEGYAPEMLCTYAHFDVQYDAARSHWDFSIPGGTLDLSPHRRLMHPLLPEGPLRSLEGLIRHPATAPIGALLHEVCAEASLGHPHGPLRASGLLTEVVALSLRCLRRSNEGLAQAPVLEKAAAFIHDQCHRELSLEAIAQRAGLSTSHFRKLFHQHFGCAPREYLARSRIQKAKQFMMEHDLNLSEIADRLGFANVHSFSRAFRASEGKSPGAWRRFGKNEVRVEGRMTGGH